MRKPRALTRAELHWAAGEPLPLDVEIELMTLGLDVQLLHTSFINRRKRQRIG